MRAVRVCAFCLTAATLFACGAPSGGEAGHESRLAPASPPESERHSADGSPTEAGTDDAASEEVPGETAARSDPARLAELRETAEREPDNAGAQRELGLGLRAARRHRDAIAPLERAVRLEPTNTRYRMDLALGYTAAARLSDAEAVYRELLAEPRLRATVLHNLGNIALRRDELDAAIESYRQALTLNPEYLLARFHLAVALQEKGLLTEAYQTFEQVLRSPTPQDSKRHAVYFDALYQLGALQLAAGSPERAVELLSQLLQYYPDHPNALFAYGRAMKVLGRDEEARQAFERHMSLPDRTEGRIGYLGTAWRPEDVDDEGFSLSFTDATEAAGIRYRNLCGSERDKNWITETLGAGAAWLDYDGDGILDLYLVNGSAHDRPKGAGEPNQLYRGDGRGGFRDVSAAAGVGDRGWGYGIAVGDYDNDGDPDLYVTNYGPNVLFRNEGDGTFRDVTGQAGVGDERWGTSAAFFDMDSDGDLDLYVGNYLECTPETVPRRGQAEFCGFKGMDVVCGPKPLVPSQDVMYRNEGNGTFRDVTRDAGMWLETPLYTLGVVTGDFDGDGRTDVYVANDSVPNLLWRNLGNGKFVDVGLESMTSVSAEGRAQSGMGTDFGDYNGDGWLDIVVTNFSHDLNTIYRNVQGEYFVDDSSASGMSVTSMVLSWGVGFRDFDNDADLDLFVANGHVYPEIDDHDMGTTYKEPNHIFVNQGGGRLVESSSRAGPGFGLTRSFRGAAFGDYDNDGDIDVLATAMGEPALLLRNDSLDGNHFLALRLIGTRSNADAVGARVTVTAGGKTQIAERHGGGSFLSASDPRLHFGLGRATRARVEVRWPSGTQDVLEDVAADRLLTLREGSSGTAR